MSASLELFTDGGSQRNGAAAACIIADGNKREKVIAYLGQATNNEAEIYSLLLGLMRIRNRADKRSGVKWFADSEYTLKSATEYIFNWQRNGWKTSTKDPVKNQGLWKHYVELVEGIKLSPNHVRGHTGHPENEECDEACLWGIHSGSQILQAEDDEIDGVGPGDEWILVDGRAHIGQLRANANKTLKASQANIFESDTESGALEKKLKEAKVLAERTGETAIVRVVEEALSLIRK